MSVMRVLHIAICGTEAICSTQKVTRVTKRVLQISLSLDMCRLARRARLQTAGERDEEEGTRARGGAAQGTDGGYGYVHIKHRCRKWGGGRREEGRKEAADSPGAPGGFYTLVVLLPGCSDPTNRRRKYRGISEETVRPLEGKTKRLAPQCQKSILTRVRAAGHTTASHAAAAPLNARDAMGRLGESDESGKNVNETSLPLPLPQSFTVSFDPYSSFSTPLIPTQITK